MNRLLLISYHFAPGESVGALRWQKLTSLAAERGWGVDVVTHDPLPSATEPPPGVRVQVVPRSPLFLEYLERLAATGYRALRARPGNGTAAHAQASSGSANGKQPEPGAALRAYNAWLDYARDLRWARSAAAVAGRLVGADTHSAVISCGPPHMAHWAGRLVAERTGLPFVMDLRDPWSLCERLAGHIASPLWYRLARQYERIAVARSSLIVMNTEFARKAMQRAYPEAAARTIAVRNGFDEDEIVSARSGDGPSRFTIMFAGSVYLDRNPRLLLQAAAIAVRDLQLTPDDFRIEFVGHVGSTDSADPSSIGAMARDHGLERFIGVTGFRPRHELGELLRKATMLVSLNQDSHMAIPSKIFEYMQYPAWLVALAEPGTATEQLLRGTDADVVAPTDTAALADVLRRRYVQHRRGERPVRLSGDARFSRRTQAKILFDAIDRVVAPQTFRGLEPALAGGGRGS